MVIAHFPNNQTNKPVKTVLPNGNKKQLIKPLAELNKPPATLTILDMATPNSPKLINSTNGKAITKPNCTCT